MTNPPDTIDPVIFCGWGRNTAPPRKHPWTVSEDDPAGRYYDFKAQPELIRTALEDAKPLQRFAAVATLCELFHFLNSEASPFETNDFGIRPPSESKSPQFPHALTVHARLTILFRKLVDNTKPEQVHWLGNQIIGCLQHRAASVPAAVEMSLWAHEFTEIGNEEGNVLLMQIWAWGNDDDEAMENLNRLLSAMQECFRSLTAYMATLPREPRSEDGRQGAG